MFEITDALHGFVHIWPWDVWNARNQFFTISSISLWFLIPTCLGLFPIIQWSLLCKFWKSFMVLYFFGNWVIAMIVSYIASRRRVESRFIFGNEIEGTMDESQMQALATQIKRLPLLSAGILGFILFDFTSREKIPSNFRLAVNCLCLIAEIYFYMGMINGAIQGDAESDAYETFFMLEIKAIWFEYEVDLFQMLLGCLFNMLIFTSQVCWNTFKNPNALTLAKTKVLIKHEHDRSWS